MMFVWDLKNRRRLERIKSDTIIEFSEDLILTPIKISKIKVKN